MDRRLKELFIEAVKERNVEKTRACINLFDADVNEYDDDGTPILFTAMQNSNLLELFLTHPNIDVNIKCRIHNGNDVYFTALIVACALERPDAVRRLCQVPDIDLNYQETTTGVTAAMWAVIRNNQDCVKILSTVPGVDWRLESNNGLSPITQAIKLGHTEILRILLTIPSIDLNATDVTHIVQSDTASSVQCLELLSRDSRINWNVRNAEGDTPIMYTLKNKKSEMFKILMTVPSIDFSVLQNQMDPFILECLKQVPHLAARVVSPECPVCYERFSRNGHIFHCNNGHFVCGRCQQQIHICPRCRGQMIGRAHDFEQFLQTLNI